MGIRAKPKAGAEAERVQAVVFKEFRQRGGSGKRAAHDGGDLGGDLGERGLRAADCDEPRSDPERAPGGEAGRARLAGAAGEDDGVAVGVFVVGRGFSEGIV